MWSNNEYVITLARAAKVLGAAKSQTPLTETSFLKRIT